MSALRSEEVRRYRDQLHLRLEDMHRFARCSTEAVEPLGDDPNTPDNDMSCPAPDRSEDQQDSRFKAAVSEQPDHVEPPRKQSGHFESASTPGSAGDRRGDYERYCKVCFIFFLLFLEIGKATLQSKQKYFFSGSIVSFLFFCRIQQKKKNGPPL